MGKVLTLVLAVLLSFPVLARDSLKDSFIERLSVCDALILEKRFHPKGIELNSDSIEILYGCVGQEPETRHYVKKTDEENSEEKYEAGLKLFDRLVEHYKNSPEYVLTGQANTVTNKITFNKYRFDKKQ